MIAKILLPIALALMTCASPVLAASGGADDPVVVRMTRGTDTIRLTGVLRQNRDCCAYRFKAHAGQVLHWRVSGPAIRVTLTYPDGQADGPGLPSALPLPDDGAYVFSVRPNLMADGAFGRFTLRLTIPPAPRAGSAAR
jgi:hypothetical protein